MKTSSATLLETTAAHATEADAIVITAVLRGDHARFAELVRRHNQRLFRLGMAYLRHPELVEDAMQDTYLHAFQHLEQFDGRAAFSTWLSRIMINECLMQLRRMRRREEARRATETDPLIPRVDHGHGARHLAADEVQALLEQSIAALPEPYRVVYVLREIQQLDTEETADLLALSPENVKVRLHRARDMLKNQLLATTAGKELFPYRAERCDPFTARVMTLIAGA